VLSFTLLHPKFAPPDCTFVAECVCSELFRDYIVLTCVAVLPCVLRATSRNVRRKCATMHVDVDASTPPQTVRMHPYHVHRDVSCANVGLGMAADGVWNTSDPQWDTDFENVFTQEALMVKWYSVLGNHDYGFNPEAQLQYVRMSGCLCPLHDVALECVASRGCVCFVFLFWCVRMYHVPCPCRYVSPNNNRWVMDARYYSRRVLVADDVYITFIMLDTNPCVTAYRNDDPSQWDPCGSTYPSPADCQFHQNILKQSCTAQYNWLKETLAAVPSGDWIIGVGHHVANEIDAEDLMGELINANMDLYLNGHAHTLTYYTMNGGGHYVTTGAGCMVKIDDDVEEVVRPHPVLATNEYTVSEVWNQKIAGFTTHQFSSDLKSLTTTFVDYNGNNLYDFTITKGSNGPSDTGSCKTYGCVYGKYNKCQCNSYCEKCALQGWSVLCVPGIALPQCA